MINPFKSRANWVFVIATALTVVQTAEPFLDPAVFTLITTILGALGVYFRTFPSQHAE